MRAPFSSATHVRLPKNNRSECTRQDSNLHPNGGASETPASAGSAIGAYLFSRNTQHATPSMHRAGLEPATVRLKAGGSAVELSVRHTTSRVVHMHREGFETPADALEGRCSCPVELPVRGQFVPHRFLLVANMSHVPFDPIRNSQCTRQESNLQPSG